MDEQPSGDQHLTRRVLKLLARDSSQELAEGHWRHCRPHRCKPTLRQLVRPPGVQLGWPTCGTAPDQITSIHLHMLTTVYLYQWRLTNSRQAAAMEELQHGWRTGLGTAVIAACMPTREYCTGLLYLCLGLHRQAQQTSARPSNTGKIIGVEALNPFKGSNHNNGRMGHSKRQNRAPRKAAQGAQQKAA